MIQRLTSRLTLPLIWRLLLPVGLFCVLALKAVPPNDFWWHLRVGEIILREGAIPTVDRFTFTQLGQPWTNQAWLVQVLYALLYRSGGLALIVLVHAVTIAAGYALAMAAATASTDLRSGVVAAFVGTAVGLQNWAVRPQFVSFLAFGLLLYLLEAHRQGRRNAIWWVAPLFVLWVNSHGGFIFGIAALGLYVLGRLWRFWRAGMPAAEQRPTMLLAAAGLLALAALAVNPAGPMGMVNYVLGFVQNEATVNFNQEFAPLTIRNPDGMAFFAATFALVLLLLVTRFRPTADQVLSLVLFAVLALMGRRVASWYGLLLIPALAGALHAWGVLNQPLQPGRQRINGLLLAVMAGAVLVVMPLWRHALPTLADRRPLLSTNTPVDATEFLCATFAPGTPGYQYQVFASYQVYACPDLPLFIDTRFELYPIEQWDDYLAIGNGRHDWQAVADRYGMDYLFLDPASQEHGLAAALASPGWTELYRDDLAVILVRR